MKKTYQLMNGPLGHQMQSHYLGYKDGRGATCEEKWLRLLPHLCPHARCQLRRSCPRRQLFVTACGVTIIPDSPPFFNRDVNSDFGVPAPGVTAPAPGVTSMLIFGHFYI